MFRRLARRFTTSTAAPKRSNFKWIALGGFSCLALVSLRSPLLSDLSSFIHFAFFIPFRVLWLVKAKLSMLH
jgi:hypothetical protein